MSQEGYEKMNGKQVKKWALVSFVICFISFMIPTMWGCLGQEVIGGDIITVASRIGGTFVAIFCLVSLGVLIYSDEIIFYFDKRGG